MKSLPERIETIFAHSLSEAVCKGLRSQMREGKADRKARGGLRQGSLAGDRIRREEEEDRKTSPERGNREEVGR